jgi:FkbM family methyltransferase
MRVIRLISPTAADPDIVSEIYDGLHCGGSLWQKAENSNSSIEFSRALRNLAVAQDRADWSRFKGGRSPMSVLNWCFIALNVMVCLGCLLHAFSKREKWSSPSNWIWVWQLVGVVLVVSLKFNPWHLIWWYIVGPSARRIILRVRRDAPQAWKMPRLYQNWPLAFLSLFAWHRRALVFRLRQGVEFRLHAPTYDSYIINEIWMDKVYTPSPEFSIRDGWVVVDVGGHKGIFAVFAATSAKDVKVYSFEASPENFACLSHNVDLNKLSNVKAFNVAVGGQDGESILNLYEESGQNTLLQRSDARLQPVGSVRVETWSLARVLKTAATQVNLLKMDIEGMEYETLFSCPDEYLQRVERIALEYHDVLVRVPHTIDDLVEFLNARGFSTFLSPGSQILLAERIPNPPFPSQSVLSVT